MPAGTSPMRATTPRLAAVGRSARTAQAIASAPSVVESASHRVLVAQQRADPGGVDPRPRAGEEHRRVEGGAGGEDDAGQGEERASEHRQIRLVDIINS